MSREHKCEPRRLVVETDNLLITLFQHDTGKWQAYIEDESHVSGCHFSWSYKYPYQAIKAVIQIYRSHKNQRKGPAYRE